MHPRKKNISRGLHQTLKPCSYSPITTPVSVQLLHETVMFLKFLLTPGLSESWFWDSQPYVTGKRSWTPRSPLDSPNHFAGWSYEHATHQTNRDESVEEVVESKTSYISFCWWWCYSFKLHVDFVMDLASISLHRFQKGNSKKHSLLDQCTATITTISSTLSLLSLTWQGLKQLMWGKWQLCFSLKSANKYRFPICEHFKGGKGVFWDKALL